MQNLIIKNMISFIVIGRNEGWKLSRCLESICNTIKYNKLINFEIFYVDSNSSDDSLERAKKFENIKIIKITGNYNAAIARNIGANESNGKVLFFIDGDMEINKINFSLLYTDKKGLKYNFCSGNFINYFYSVSGEFLSESLQFQTNENKIDYIVGGLFLIKKSLWTELGGMTSYLERSQDYDFAFRLANNGCFLKRIKEPIAIHHTVSYLSFNRRLELFKKGSQFYRVVILRNNFFNKYQWNNFIRNNYTFFLLLMLLFFSITLNNLNILFLYLFVILLRSIKRNNFSLSRILIDFPLIFIYEILIIFSFLFFWPKVKSLKYEYLN